MRIHNNVLHKQVGLCDISYFRFQKICSEKFCLKFQMHNLVSKRIIKYFFSFCIKIKLKFIVNYKNKILLQPKRKYYNIIISVLQQTVR